MSQSGCLAHYSSRICPGHLFWTLLSKIIFQSLNIKRLRGKLPRNCVTLTMISERLDSFGRFISFSFTVCNETLRLWFWICQGFLEAKKVWRDYQIIEAHVWSTRGQSWDIKSRFNPKHGQVSFNSGYKMNEDFQWADELLGGWESCLRA